MKYYFEKKQGGSWVTFLIIIVILVLAYISPQFFKDFFGAIWIGAENFLTSIFDVIREQTPFFNGNSSNNPDGSNLFLPGSINCSSSLLNHFSKNDWVEVSFSDGVKVMSQAKLSARIIIALPKGTPVRIDGSGVCINESVFWPIYWFESGEKFSGWAIGGEMKDDESYDLFFVFPNK